MVALLLHTVRGLAAVGIFATIAIVSSGNFFTALRNYYIDCDQGSTHNAGACVVDVLEGAVYAVLTVTFGGAAIVGTGILPRDSALDASGFHMAHVDGVAVHKWEVFNRDWMNANLREGERKYILANTTNLAPDGGKVMTEAWLQNGTLKLTQYPHKKANTKDKRAREVYLHYSSEQSNIPLAYPNIKTSYTYARNAAQHIFDNMANRNARSNCIGFEFQAPGNSLVAAEFGLEGSYAYTNDAPVNCHNPYNSIGQNYEQIGDMYLTGY